MKKYFDAYYGKNTYSNRMHTDSLFMLPQGSINYEGVADRAVRFVEDKQLCDIDMWTRFVRVFEGTPDDADLGWRGEFWGKTMRGAAWVYSYTLNERLYQTMTQAVEGLLNTQDSYGRFSSYSLDKEFNGWDMWGRKYVMLGMQYYYEICRSAELKERIVTALIRHADYILDHIGEGKRGILTTSHFWGCINSATILEAMLRLYNITGFDRYFEFGKYIVKTGGCRGANLIELAYEDKLYPHEYPFTKAYEMMSFFEGVLEFYRLTGEPKYKIAVENFIAKVKESEITVIGCAGCTHELFDNSVLQQTRSSQEIMQETCVTVTWMKLCFQYLCLDGDGVYADYIEHSLYNAYLGSINYEGNIVKNTCLPFDSYSPLRDGVRGCEVGGNKLLEGNYLYGCCASIGSAGAGLLGMYGAMMRKDGLTLNNYSTGKIVFLTPSVQQASLDITTKYPIDGLVNITLNLKRAEKFCIALRKPHWSKQVAVSVNGESCFVQTEKGYILINREWSNNDVIVLDINVDVRVVEINGAVAYMKGPIALAQDERLGKKLIEKITVNNDVEPDYEVLSADNAGFGIDMLVRLSVGAGVSLDMIDYASAGQDYNNNCKVSVWLEKAN